MFLWGFLCAVTSAPYGVMRAQGSIRRLPQLPIELSMLCPSLGLGQLFRGLGLRRGGLLLLQYVLACDRIPEHRRGRTSAIASQSSSQASGTFLADPLIVFGEADDQSARCVGVCWVASVAAAAVRLRSAKV